MIFFNMGFYNMAYKCEEDLFCGINRAKISDPNNMNDFEKTHSSN